MEFIDCKYLSKNGASLGVTRMVNIGNNIVLLVGVLLYCSVVKAQTITVSNPTVAVGALSASVDIDFVAGASPVAGYGGILNFTRSPPVVASGATTNTNVDGACGGVGISTPTGTSISFGAFDLSLSPLVSGTTCKLVFPMNPAAPAGTYVFTITAPEFTDTAGNPVSGIVNPGGITIGAKGRD